MSSEQDGQRLRFGMAGGGEGAFIGQVHWRAAQLDGDAQLVCGAFSSNAETSRRSGQQLYGLPADRCYSDFESMLAAEAAMPAEQAMHFVVIATPNHMHFPMADAALGAGFHVVCDKPLVVSLPQAQALAERVEDSGLKFALTHNYTGYPMLVEARALISSGALGEIRRVDGSYMQGWLSQPVQDNKQAAWRTDPERAGVAGCFGDIGSHVENLISTVTGLQIESLCADLTTFVDGRGLDDDGNVLLRYSNGAKGVISASQIAAGKENDLRLSVFGTRGGLEWSQANANSLFVHWHDKPTEVRRTGGPGITPQSSAATRIPAGHPEGYLEAFANLYRNFCADVRGESGAYYPGVQDGVRGVRFIQRVVESAAAGARWVDF